MDATNSFSPQKLGPLRWTNSSSAGFEVLPRITLRGEAGDERESQAARADSRGFVVAPRPVSSSRQQQARTFDHYRLRILNACR